MMVIKSFEAFFEFTCLDTLLPLMLPRMGECFLTHKVRLQLLPKLLCLRMLSLRARRQNLQIELEEIFPTQFIK
jgi:hypothetical protein